MRLVRINQGSFTNLSIVSMTVVRARWYLLKVVVSGCNHKVYVDNVLKIDRSNCTYPGPGLIGVRSYISEGEWDWFRAYE